MYKTWLSPGFLFCVPMPESFNPEKKMTHIYLNLPPFVVNLKF